MLERGRGCSVVELRRGSTLLLTTVGMVLPAGGAREAVMAGSTEAEREGEITIRVGLGQWKVLLAYGVQAYTGVIPATSSILLFCHYTCQAQELMFIK